MPKRGTRPTPTEDLNSWRKELRERKGELKVEQLAACPKAAPWLKGRERYYWSKLAPTLHANSLLSAPDIAAVALACQLMAQVETYNKQIDGTTPEASDGEMKPHQLHIARKHAIAELRKLLADIGVTATSRIGMPKAAPPTGEITAFNHFKKG